jgi:hypothetical protein
MKENTQKIIGIFIIMMFVCLTPMNIHANILDTAQKGASMAQTGTSLINTLGGVVSGGANLLFGGGNPWISVAMGAAVGVFTGINAYKELGETAKFELEKDKVNISGKDGDFLSKNATDKIKIDFNSGKDAILTDQNVLDLYYIPTREINYYSDDNSPSYRVSELTDKIKVTDLNGNLVNGQRRSFLFEDKEQTIKRDTETRYFAIKYGLAEYKENPIMIKESANIFDWTVSGVYETFLRKAQINLDKEIEKRTVDPLKKIQAFRLVFNSMTPDEYYIPGDQLNCTTQSGEILGTTGTEYLPKIEYDWTFKSNNESVSMSAGPDIKTLYEEELSRTSWCDTEENGIYCDATQFTIEALFKINKISQLLPNCIPQMEASRPSIERELESNYNNVGLISLVADKTDSRNIEIEYSILGNYDIDYELFGSREFFNIVTTVEAKAPNSFTWQEITTPITKPISSSYLITGEPVDFTEDVSIPSTITEEHTIRIVVEMTDFIEEISEHETGINLQDNKLQLEFLNKEELKIFETNSTKIQDYLIGKDCQRQFDNLIKFNVNLMRDGFSQGFIKDFDNLYRTIFLESPDFYYQDQSNFYTPLYKYFTNEDKFGFKMPHTSEKEDFVVSGPGVYEVELRIDYDDNWQLFDAAGNPTGKIEIHLRKIRNPQYDSVLYYLPLNGVLGYRDNNRQGYGVEYVGDVIDIDQTTQLHGQPLQTSGYIESHTLKTINIDQVENFSIMNNTERGKILSVNMPEMGHTATLKYTPSRPTPVALRIKNNENNAFAFYNLSLGAPKDGEGQPAQPGMSLVPWTGFAGCTDFRGIPSFEIFRESLDVVSTRSRLAPITPNDPFTYGVEWSANNQETNRVGNVWLHTIFYTPTTFKTGTGISHLYMNAYQDDAVFYTLNDSVISGREVSLNNIYGNNNDIKSLKQILEMIANKQACINTNSSMLEVYHNPKVISDLLKENIEEMIYTEDIKCIDAKRPDETEE